MLLDGGFGDRPGFMPANRSLVARGKVRFGPFSLCRNSRGAAGRNASKLSELAQAQLRMQRHKLASISRMILPRQILLLSAVVSSAVAILLGCASPQKGHDASTPISVTASTTGRFAKGHSWSLSVDTDRKARLTIDSYPQAQTREFEVSTEQINELAAALEKERFFDLQPDYGQMVPDGSTRVIKVVQGGEANTVRIHFLMNWVHSNPSKLKEPARALRVFRLVREWFDDEDAVDLKRYEDMVLKAAGKDS